jgi:flagellar biosynthesis GTPase FlhF
MKLYRFTALDTQRAMIKINEMLGAEALIYSTRKIPHGVEMLAGLACDNHEETASVVQLKIAESNRELIDKLNIQLQRMDESVQHLTTQIHQYQEEAKISLYKKCIRKLKSIQWFKRNLKEGAYERQPANT